MYYWGTVGGPSPRGLDAIAWASAGGGAARILAVPPGGRRAPLRGAGSSPGRGVRPCRGGAARPWCPPVVAALVAEDPAPSLPVGDGWHLVVPRRIWRRLEPGACPASRAPADPDGPRRPWCGAAGGGGGACGGGSDRGMRRLRGGGGERRRQPRGEGECGVFFILLEETVVRTRSVIRTLVEGRADMRRRGRRGMR